MKKGFTLVEIIISIGLVVLIGTVSIVSFNLIKNNDRENILNNMNDEILTALRLYIETNDEVKNKIYNNYEGMAITLNTLEDEGLIDFQDIDVSDGKDYVVALLSQESGCSDITMIESWNLTNGPLSICLKSNGTNSSIKKELTDGDGYYIAKGKNPNNWIKFNVSSSTSKPAYFPNDSDKNLWRIVSINNNGEIKLVYNKNIVTNNSKTYTTTSYNCSKNGTTYYTLKSNYSNIHTCSAEDTCYYIYTNNSDWSYEEIASDSGKKLDLINAITNKQWLKKSEYYLQYHSRNNSTGAEGFEETYVNTTNSKELKMGVLSKYEYLDTFLFGSTWIIDSFIFGVDQNNKDYNVLYLTNNGNIDIISKIVSTNCNRAYDLFYTVSGAPYLPVIVLNSDVEIIKNSSCEDDAIQGSKSCPYLLQCENC